LHFILYMEDARRQASSRVAIVATVGIFPPYDGKIKHDL